MTEIKFLKNLKEEKDSIYEIINDYQKNQNYSEIYLKKGFYTEKYLLSIFGSKDVFNFCLLCTDLKNHIKIKTQEVQLEEVQLEEAKSEEVQLEEAKPEEVQLYYVINKKITINGEVIKKGSKKTFAELQEIFGSDLDGYLEDETISETKSIA